MSLATDIFQQCLAVDEAVFGDSLRLATGDRSGFRFSGVIMPAEVIDPETMMRDPRERGTLELDREAVGRLGGETVAIAGFIRENDRIDQGTGQNIRTWVVVAREDNPSDIVMRFDLVKVVSGKDL
jgi:hypothetical protein